MSDDALPLDEPVGGSLRGHHARLARRLGRAATYLPGVATFAAVPTAADPSDWADLARLLGKDAFADMFSCPATPPADWEPVMPRRSAPVCPAMAGGAGTCDSGACS